MSTTLSVLGTPFTDFSQSVATPPVNLTPPVVSGNPWLGEALTYDPGTWTAGTESAHLWQYTPSLEAIDPQALTNGDADAADLPAYLEDCWVRVGVKFDDSGAESEYVYSEWYGPITEVPVVPTITTGTSPAIASGATTVVIVRATGTTPITWSITGGADSALFSIQAAYGTLTFNDSPDYDNPTDADTDNVYVVQVTATNDAGTDAETFNVRVFPAGIIVTPAQPPIRSGIHSPAFSPLSVHPALMGGA